MSLGATIPLIDFFPPKDPRLDHAIEEGLRNADVLLLANHGVLAVGKDLEQAFLRIELVEHLAKIKMVAQQLGGARPLPQELVDKLGKKGRPASHAHGQQGATKNTSSSIPSINVSKVVSEALKKHL